jgi:hypothetical protein
MAAMSEEAQQKDNPKKKKKKKEQVGEEGRVRRRTWNEQRSDSSTSIMALALSNSPQ